MRAQVLRLHLEQARSSASVARSELQAEREEKDFYLAKLGLVEQACNASSGAELQKQVLRILYAPGQSAEEMREALSDCPQCA